MGWVVVFLQPQRLAVQGAVDVRQLALEAVALFVVLAPYRRLCVRQLEAQQLESIRSEDPLREEIQRATPTSASSTWPSSRRCYAPFPTTRWGGSIAPST